MRVNDLINISIHSSLLTPVSVNARGHFHRFVNYLQEFCVFTTTSQLQLIRSEISSSVLQELLLLNIYIYEILYHMLQFRSEILFHPLLIVKLLNILNLCCIHICISIIVNYRCVIHYCGLHLIHYTTMQVLRIINMRLKVTSKLGVLGLGN